MGSWVTFWITWGAIPPPPAPGDTVLTTFADLSELSRNRPSGSEEEQDQQVHSPREYFHAYLHSLDVDREGLPESFRTRLRQALRHYDIGDLDVEGLFIAIGYEPNTAAFRDWLEVDEKGYLVVRDETRSKIDGVFIAGDVHDHRYRQAVTAAADGCKAAIDAERWLEAQGITEVATATAW